MDKLVRRCLEATSQEKIKQTHEALGYSTEDLLAHLKSFPNWNKLKNTTWHLDHVFPVIAFVDKGILDISLISSLDNLQPLSAKENIKKGDNHDKKAFEEWLESKTHL